MTSTVDERSMRAPALLCFAVAADVERWPAILPHYRTVRFRGAHSLGTGRVEMSAWREFAGPLRYPTWWVSDMRAVEAEPAIYFEHVAGITRGMQVKWAFQPDGSDPGATRVRITHEWQGPHWPMIGPTAWRHVIGPHFVSFIAQRTLAGIATEAERRNAGDGNGANLGER